MAVAKVALPKLDDQRFFNAFLDITDAWHLSDRHRWAILDVPERTFYNWKAGKPHLHNSHRERIALITNIYLALQSIFSSEPLANAWVHTPNRFLDERTPLQEMQRGEVSALLRLHDYLMAAQ